MSHGIFFLHTRTDARTPGGPWPLAPLASAIHRIIIPRFHQHHDSRGSDDRGEATLPQTSQRCDHGCCNIHLDPERVPALRRLLLLLPIDGGGGHRSGGTFSPTVVPRFIVQSWDPGEGGWNDAVWGWHAIESFGGRWRRRFGGGRDSGPKKEADGRLLQNWRPCLRAACGRTAREHC